MKPARYKGVYVISETGTLYPSTGANAHIRVGIEQLNKYFDIERILFCKPLNENTPDRSGSEKLKAKPAKSNKFRQFAKWFYILISNHLRIFKYYSGIRKKQPLFIYERAGYLNYNGLIIAKLLKIPHVYEVNGIAANDHSKYFPSICNRISYWLEKKAYKGTTFGFYVGGLNEYFNIASNKYSVVQNGIDDSFAEIFKNRRNKVVNKINLTFIGHAMDHHRLDLLVEAVLKIKDPAKFRLHFIGPGLEYLQASLPTSLETEFYGSLTHQEIAKLIGTFNLAIIPYALDYFSHVKAFMYGAAKLAIILPDTKNFKSIFSEKEVIFIRNGNSNDIADKLNFIADNPGGMEDYGENIYKKVSASFTWEKIYYEVAQDIMALIKMEGVNSTARIEAINLKIN